MALKRYKPTTATRRHTALIDNTKLSKVAPEKSLTTKVRYRAGKGSTGRITIRHKGGRVKRKYRVIDFLRDKYDIAAVVKTIEYDPYRSANIALLQYSDGEKRYILSPDGLNIGEELHSGNEVEIKIGNALPMEKIPTGMMLHNIELTKGRGGVLCRSAGTSAQLMAIDSGYAQLRMPSGEVRLVKASNYATIGELGNKEHGNVKIGKAGRNRYKGIRPSVRGMAMHAVEHPHGGGEGKGQIGGMRKDIYGNKWGRKTRKNKRTNRFIVKRKTTRQRPKVKKLN